MLKMYHKRAFSGSSPDFWEESWETNEFEESVRFCSVDPLRPLFEKYLRPGSLVLEGGCGTGNYVSYYAARGFNIIGLDFALKALKTLRTRQPHVKLCGGDVSRLPFADKTFDLYYSGGVVEHFEGGSEESLREARRVLKDDGVLLISVPYYSPLRRILLPFRRNEWRSVEHSTCDQDELFRDRAFFQYAYRASEFKDRLENAGLRVISNQGYAVLWGLHEIPFLDRNGKSGFPAAPQNASSSRSGAVDVNDLVKDKPMSIGKRLIVSEDDSIPLLGLGVKLMRWASANMMMYVCTRN